MKTKTIAYWTTTTLIALETLAGGVTDLAQGRSMLVSGPSVAEVVTQLGYPLYILVILGVWKLLGAITLLAPCFPRLKEWAYAGIFFELTGAAASQAANGNWGEVTAPILLTALTITSWALRPPSRTLPKHAAA